MGDAMVCLFADESGTEESVLLHDLDRDYFEPLIDNSELVLIGPHRWALKDSLLAVMQANPTAELVVTMDSGHPAYLRDSTNRENSSMARLNKTNTSS